MNEPDRPDKQAWEESARLRARIAELEDQLRCCRLGRTEDITEWARTEAACVRSEAWLRAAMAASNTGLWDWDLRTNVVHFSSEWKRQIGYVDDEITDRFEEWESRVHPDDLDDVQSRFQEYLSAPQGQYEAEFRFRHKDGSYRTILARAAAICGADGRPSRFVGCHIDITAMKQAELALWASASEHRRQREFLECLIAHAGACIAVVRGRELRYTLANPASEAYAGGVPMVGRTYREVFPEAARAGAEGLLLRVLETGEPWVVDGYDTPLAGIGDAMWQGHVVRLPAEPGEEPSALAVVWDISARRQAEEALRKSEERLRLAQHAAGVGIWDWDMATGQIDWTPELEAMYGFEPGTFAGDYASFVTRVHPDDLAEVERQRDAAVAAHQLFDFDFRVSLPTGEIRWVNCKGAAHYDSAGQPQRVFGVSLDITSRKQAEMELERIRSQLAEGQRIAHLGSWEYITATQQTVWSEEERRIYGLAPDAPSPDYETLLRRFIHPDDAGAVDRKFRAALQDGRPFEIENRIVRSDGSVRQIYNRALPYFDSAGQLVRYVGATLDITERKRAEEALKASLREKEVLLKEIHHRVKNNMQVISSIVSLQAGRTTDEAVRAVLQDVAHRIRSMSLVHEKLYQSADLTSVDFAEYARSLLTHQWRSQQSSSSGVRLALELQPVTLAIHAAVPCGLILHELASNALKHAFPGDRGGEVTVSLVAAPEGRVCLRVRDNGVGLPAGFAWPAVKSLGLQLVQVLAEQLDAEVEVVSREGTEIAVAFEGAKP